MWSEASVTSAAAARGNGGANHSSVGGGSERYDRATSVTILPDGKILVGGDSIAAVLIQTQFGIARFVTSDIALLRLNPDGTLDQIFGVSGAVRTDLSNLGDDTVVRVLPLADGSIRVVGTSSVLDGFTSTPSWTVVGFTSNGTLDASYGAGGRTVIGFSGGSGLATARDAILQNGKIVITGARGDYAPLVVARLDAATGQRDASFGVDGIATVDLPVPARFGAQSRQGWSLAAQPDGKVLVAGDGTLFDFLQDFFEPTLLTVSRLTADGQTDATFNAFPNDSIQGYGPSIAIVGGRIVFADSLAPKLTLAANGGITGNFGSFLAGTNTSVRPTVLNFASLAGQADGGLLAAGTINGDAAIARFTFDGSVTPPPPPPPPPAPTVPAAPTNLSASSVAPRSVGLTWRDNANNETNYVVQRSSTSNFTNAVTLATLGSNATSFIDRTVVARTTYFYRVTARNALGGALSPTLAVTTPRR